MALKAPSFQFYPKDWLEFKVVRMSDTAQGVYMRLLCHIWIGTETQYKIKNDDRLLARCLGVSVQKWKKIKKEIQYDGDMLLQEEKGYLISQRLKDEREKQELRREQTKKASNIRWEKTNQTDNQTDMRRPSPSTASTTPIPSSTTKDLKPCVASATKKKTDPNIKIFINDFCVTFRKKTNVPYLVKWGKDSKLAQEMLKVYSLSELQFLKDKFFNSQDKFILKAGYSIGVFSSVVNKLISGGDGGYSGIKEWLNEMEGKVEK